MFCASRGPLASTTAQYLLSQVCVSGFRSSKIEAELGFVQYNLVLQVSRSYEMSWHPSTHPLAAPSILAEWPGNHRVEGKRKQFLSRDSEAIEHTL